MDKLRVAVVGLNGIGGRHAKSLAEMDRVDLVAVADLREDLRDGFSGATAYADYREMVEKENLDAVVIATPHFLHAPMGLFCLEAGLHTFVEKPVAMTVSEADQMVETAEAKNRGNMRAVVC